MMKIPSHNLVSTLDYLEKSIVDRLTKPILLVEY